jgi:hypothetical protein
MHCPRSEDQYQHVLESHLIAETLIVVAISPLSASTILAPISIEGGFLRVASIQGP